MKEPTPTTLRETLYRNSFAVETHPKDFVLRINEKGVEDILRQTQEQLKALLPEKRERTYGIMSTFENLHDERNAGFNQAIDQIEKAIEEWAK